MNQHVNKRQVEIVNTVKMYKKELQKPQGNLPHTIITIGDLKELIASAHL